MHKENLRIGREVLTERLEDKAVAQESYGRADALDDLARRTSQVEHIPIETRAWKSGIK